MNKVGLLLAGIAIAVAGAGVAIVTKKDEIDISEEE